MNRLQEFKRYHVASERIGDIDPSYPMLRYVCDRFELNTEQRYWLAWLYAATYCGPTVFWIYNEFPDYELVDEGRLERWWTSKGRKHSVFQSDRRWVRSRNQFCQMFASYRNTVGENQEAWFASVAKGDPGSAYRAAYKACGECFQMGRFGLFLWLEAVHVVTGLKMEPDAIDWRHAESSRNGLLFAFGADHLLRGNDYGDDPFPSCELAECDSRLESLIWELRTEFPDVRSDAWNVETSLCAFKKWKRRKRYVGYYLDRQAQEIESMSAVPGVCWDVLWQFRSETVPHKYLKERGGAAGRYWTELFRQIPKECEVSFE